jgi:hypothetical protein
MNLFSILAGVSLTILSSIAIAAPAYEIKGLYIDMTFSDAVAQAEELGGVCQLSTSQREDGVVYAQCDYGTCDKGGPADACDKQNLESPGLSIAAQPIIRVGLEAAGASSPLTRIIIIFEGSTEVVEEHLIQEYGPPHLDGSAATEKSWTNARRLHWKQGKNNMGLLTTMKMISLTTDSKSPDSAAP